MSQCILGGVDKSDHVSKGLRAVRAREKLRRMFLLWPLAFNCVNSSGLVAQIAFSGIFPFSFSRSVRRAPSPGM